MTADRVERVRIDDPRLQVYRDVRDRDLSRQALFMVEGEVTLRVLLSEAARFAPHSVLLSDKRLGSLGGALAATPAGVPVFVLPQADMESVVGFPIHRGVLAAADRGDPLPAATLLEGLGPGRHVVVALAGLTNADNVGAVFRNSAAFGACAVLLDDRCCDPLYRKAIRVSAGATLTVPWARAGSTGSLLDTVHEHGFRTLALTPGAGAIDIATVPAAPRTCLVLGTEGPGLSPVTLAAATERVRINMVNGFDSVNVATAGAIALYTMCALEERGS